MNQSDRQVPKCLQPVLAHLREQLQSLYGPRLKKVILFGSQARGDAGPDSDVDVLIVLEGPVRLGEEIRRTGDLVADLSLQSNLVISRIFMDVEEFEAGHEPLRLAVQRDGIDL